MIAHFAEVCCASVPLDSVGLLGDLRALPGVLVYLAERRVWIRWERGAERVLRLVMAVPGVVLYAGRDESWRRVGAHLPAFDVPGPEQFRPIFDVVFPAPMQPVPSPATVPVIQARFRLVRDATPRPTSGVMANVADILAWMDALPTARFRNMRAAILGRQVLVLGHRVPWLPHGERFFGRRVLRPLGFRLDPDLPETAVCDALQAAPDEMIVWHPDGRAEVVPDDVLAPLTRAGLRRAAGERNA